MKNFSWIKFVSSFVMSTASIIVMSNASAATSDPVSMLYNFQASGQFLSYDPATGQSTYMISAQGRAPKISHNGIVTPQRTIDDDGYTVSLTDAAITFDAFNPANPAPIVNFSCKGCKLKFPDGSILVSDTNVPLEGRAFFLYGPVAPNAASPIMTIRMAGCSGLKETAGVGKLANKVGSICFNGSFNFNMSNPAVITGESNCTIVTHTPAPMQ